MSNYAEGDISSNKRGTCARANSGKVRLSLFPMHLLYGATKVLMWGTKKYAEWNWAKGGKWSTAFDCMMRHLFKWWFCREELDEESGEHHLSHALCNLMFLIHFNDTYKEGDDRPPLETTRFCDSLENFNRRSTDTKPLVTMGVDPGINDWSPHPIEEGASVRIGAGLCVGCQLPKHGNCSEVCPYEAKS